MDLRDLARRAREARKETGLSQTEAAERLDVSRSGISRAENYREGDSMHSLRIRMIETFTGAEVKGPFYLEMRD